MVRVDPRRAVQEPMFELQLQRFSRLLSDMQAIRRQVSIESLAGNAPLLDRWTTSVRPATCLVGRSTGHPIFNGAGRLIATSDLILMSKDGEWARTLSRWYRLGEPLPAAVNIDGRRSWQ